MNFACDKCQKRYSIADEKVRGRTVKIRCKNCQNVMSVQEADALVDDSTAMLAPHRVEDLKKKDRAFAEQDGARTSRLDGAGNVIVSGQWFAMVKGKQVGPLEGTGLMSKAKSGEITPRTYLWKEGMADWKRAADLEEMTALFGGNLGPPAPPTGTPVPPAIRSASKPSVRAKRVEEPLPAPAPILAELFDDMPTESNGKKEPDPFAPALEKAKVRDESAVKDPFAALGELDASKLPPVGEATRFFIAQAGVNKRNPSWKIALFVAAIIGLPMFTLYLLSEQFKVVPLKITKYDEVTGQEIEHTVFSAEGVSGLGDLLMGKSKKTEGVAKSGRPARRPAPVAAAPSGGESKPGPSPVDVKEAAAKRSATGPSAQDLSALYGDGDKRDIGPKVRKGVQAKAQDTSVGGLAEAEVSRVVGQTQPAFQSCIEQEMRKNPNFKGGKVSIVATVATSGVVTKAQIDRNDIDRSGLGDCLKGRAKRMIFSSFAGEETDVQIPLILGTTL